MAGQESNRTNISAMTNADPCAVTTDAVHGYTTGGFVRITDLNGAIPIHRGMNPINNGRWEIVVTSTTAFTLKDPITHKDLDSTDFTPYVSGGYCNLIETSFDYTA